MDTEKTPSQANFVERRQRVAPAKKMHAVQDADANQALLLLLQALSELNEQAKEGEPRPSSDFNRDDVVQAVELFFDTIFSSDACSVVAKTLVGYLQVPVLKSAMQNGRFLTDARHPARRLIKALYLEAAKFESVVDLETDEHYQAMLEIVKSVSRDFESDERIFLQAYFEVSQIG